MLIRLYVFRYYPKHYEAFCESKFNVKFEYLTQDIKKLSRIKRNNGIKDKFQLQLNIQEILRNKMKNQSIIQYLEFAYRELNIMDNQYKINVNGSNKSKDSKKSRLIVCIIIILPIYHILIHLMIHIIHIIIIIWIISVIINIIIITIIHW